MKPIILASSSPRRQEILTQARLPFIVCPASDETAPEGLSPQDLTKELAHSKAACVAAAHPNSLILAADTIVVLGEQVLGKPRSKHEAVDMLLSLQGKKHQVMTGVWLALTNEVGDIVKQDGFTDIAQVEFYPISPKEAEKYVAGGEPMDKAGAYAIQGEGMRFVKGIVGDFYTVMGLPGGRLIRFIRDFAPDML